MYIKIRAKTGAKNEIVNKISDDHYEISVKEPAENNRANRKILKIIRSLYPGSAVKVISGHHSPGKIVSIE